MLGACIVPGIAVPAGAGARRIAEINENKLVGATGFEPVTPCAQGRCATRLRYAPTGYHSILNYFDSNQSLGLGCGLTLSTLNFTCQVCRLDNKLLSRFHARELISSNK